MVKFYWAIVIVATLTMIAVVAFSKNKPDNHAAMKASSVEIPGKTDLTINQVQATAVR